MARNDHSGYPLKWFKDQNAARHAYECVVCLEVLKDAVQARDCGHQFCALCIDDILKADPHCPTCRIRISDETVFDDHAARRLIKQLDVNCCNEKCTWHGTLSSLLQDHQKKCNFSIQNVHELKVQRLEQEFQALTLNVFTWNEKHGKDIKDLKLKHEQDIKELKMKHEKDVTGLKLKYEEVIKDIKLKLQQSENRLQRLEEKGKKSSGDKKWITPFVKESMEPVHFLGEEKEDFSCEKEEGMQVENENVHEKDYDIELASPVKPASRKYDRDFLLQFQFMPVCLKKPAGLPNMEVVLDSPHPQKITGVSQRGGLFAQQKKQLQQSEHRLQRLEEKGKEWSRDIKWITRGRYQGRDRSVVSSDSLQKQDQPQTNRNSRLGSDLWLRMSPSAASSSSSDESEISKDTAGVSVQEPNRTVNQSRIDGAFVVGQDPYGQPVMRHPAYTSNVPQYQMQATSAPFQPQFMAQQAQYFNKGVPQPMYYMQPNQQIQQQQPTQTQNTAIQTNNTNESKPKQSKIVIRDPKDNKDVTEEILYSNTTNGRTSDTPPLTNSTAQTRFSKIHAQFVTQIEAIVQRAKDK